MGYSTQGRKPFERASKISHAEIINNPLVQNYLEACSVPRPAASGAVEAMLTPIPPPVTRRMSTIVAVDGGFTETPVRDEFPSAAITFFTFGPLLFKLADLQDLDTQSFIAPEDLARLK